MRKLKLAGLASRLACVSPLFQPIFRSSGRIYSRSAPPRPRNSSILGKSIGRSWRVKLSTRGDLSPVSWTIVPRSEEHTSELQSLMRLSYAVFCLQKKKYKQHKQLVQRIV